jgi:hypothetical protein
MGLLATRSASRGSQRSPARSRWPRASDRIAASADKSWHDCELGSRTFRPRHPRTIAIFPDISERFLHVGYLSDPTFAEEDS